MNPHAANPRPITGRFVLVCVVAFFAVVGGVNAIMVYAASTTFGGLETDSSYKTGLAFRRAQASVQAQDALHWNVSAHVARNADGIAKLELRVADPNGVAPAGLAAKARLVHPSDARKDRDFLVLPTARGSFSATVDAPAGQWDLDIDLMRDDERVFRSRSRVVLQ